MLKLIAEPLLCLHKTFSSLRLPMQSRQPSRALDERFEDFCVACMALDIAPAPEIFCAAAAQDISKMIKAPTHHGHIPPNHLAPKSAKIYPDMLPTQALDCPGKES